MVLGSNMKNMTIESLGKTVSYDGKCNVIGDRERRRELGGNSREEKERVLSLTSPAGFAPRPV
jgi:hypothetical protein